MAQNINSEDAKKLVERWLKGDDTLNIAERVFVIEKMVKRLLLNERLNKIKK
jgi:hypothetical protein